MTPTPQAALLSALAEFNRYFASANGVDVSARISVPRDEWRALHAAILAKLQATQAEPRITPDMVDRLQGISDMLSESSRRLDRIDAEYPAQAEPVQAVELPPLPDDEKIEGRLYQDARGFVPGSIKEVIRQMMSEYARAAISARKPTVQLTDEQIVQSMRDAGWPEVLVRHVVGAREFTASLASRSVMEVKTQ